MLWDQKKNTTGRSQVRYDWLDAWGNEPEDEADNIRVYMMRCVISYTSKMHFSSKRQII